jgi:hypothetical protein
MDSVSRLYAIQSAGLTIIVFLLARCIAAHDFLFLVEHPGAKDSSNL